LFKKRQLMDSPYNQHQLQLLCTRILYREHLHGTAETLGPSYVFRFHSGDKIDIVPLEPWAYEIRADARRLFANHV
jgi:hypothetical protein